MDCKQASIVVAIFGLFMGTYCGVRSFRVWRDPDATFAYFIDGGYDQRDARNQVFLSKIVGPFLTLIGGIAGFANLFNFIACNASPRFLASLAKFCGPLQVIAFPATLAVSLVIGAIAFVLLKQERGWVRYAYVVYLVAFAFAGLQAAGYHVGLMAERWSAVAGFLVVLAAVTRYAWQKLGASSPATVSNSD